MRQGANRGREARNREKQDIKEEREARNQKKKGRQQGRQVDSAKGGNHHLPKRRKREAPCKRPDPKRNKEDPADLHAPPPPAKRSVFSVNAFGRSARRVLGRRSSLNTLEANMIFCCFFFFFFLLFSTFIYFFVTISFISNMIFRCFFLYFFFLFFFYFA